MTIRPHVFLATLAVCFTLLAANGMRGAHPSDGKMPDAFHIIYESFGTEPRQPVVEDDLPGFWASFRVETKADRLAAAKSLGAAVAAPTARVYFEKYRNGNELQLDYAVTWRSVGLQQVIGLRGERFRLQKLSGGTKLDFERIGKVATAGHALPSKVICIPLIGETIIGDHAVMIGKREGDALVAHIAPLAEAHLRTARSTRKNRFTDFDMRPALNHDSATRVPLAVDTTFRAGKAKVRVARVIPADPADHLAGWVEVVRVD